MFGTGAIRMLVKELGSWFQVNPITNGSSLAEKATPCMGKPLQQFNDIRADRLVLFSYLKIVLPDSNFSIRISRVVILA